MKRFARILIAGIAIVSLYSAYRLYNIHQHFFVIPSPDWSRVPELTDIADSTLSLYYVHSEGKRALTVESGFYANPPFDSSGIPLLNFNEVNVYNPVTIAQYALDSWDFFQLTKEARYAAVFFKQVDWLMDHEEEGRWHFQFDEESRSLKAPWISAMAQGQGISVLMRAYQETGDEKYMTTAERAFQLFTIPVSKGGIAIRAARGTWFEEYPDASTPSHVMNGHIWALFGLWDYYRVTGNEEARTLFFEGAAAVKADIDKYDTGFWVLYEQLSSAFLLSASYMDLEIDQLRALGAITGDSSFAQFADKREEYQNSPATFLMRYVFYRLPQIF